MSKSTNKPQARSVSNQRSKKSAEPATGNEEIRTSLKYLHLSRRVQLQIQEGFYRVGDRLPSVRELAATESCSVDTTIQAYARLEKLGLIHSKPHRGFFVSKSKSDEPRLQSASSLTPLSPTPHEDWYLQISGASYANNSSKNAISFSRETVDLNLLPRKFIEAATRRALKGLFENADAPDLLDPARREEALASEIEQSLGSRKRDYRRKPT